MANKPAALRPTDETVRTAENIYNAGRESVLAEIAELKIKLQVAPWLFKMAGKIEGLNFFKSQSQFFVLVMLKQVKDNKEYREKYGMTWERFCEEIGIKRRTIDEQLLDLKPFKAEFLADFRQFSGMDLWKIKYLGEVITGGAASFSEKGITYRGETIPIDQEHAPDIQALLDHLEEQHKKEREKEQAEHSRTKRALKATEDERNEKANALERIKREAEAKGLLPKEDAFFKKIDLLRLEVLKNQYLIDPERMVELFEENEPTTAMRAAYLALLQEHEMVMNVYVDQAEDLYSGAIMQPELGPQAPNLIAIHEK